MTVVWVVEHFKPLPLRTIQQTIRVQLPAVRLSGNNPRHKIHTLTHTVTRASDFDHAGSHGREQGEGGKQI